MSTAPSTAPPPLRPLRIGPLTIGVPVVLAPMAGVTNTAFRTLCRQFGGGLYVSEMITARAIVERNAKTLRMAQFSAAESPRSLQLYSTEERSVAAAARWLVETDRVDHIDLNFGCPAPKVTRNGGGAALPFKWRRFQAVVSKAVEAAGSVPVTVKMRMGIDDRHLTYLRAGRIAEEAGARAVALHARTAEQLYSGEARWEAIARLKEEVRSVPVLGNGDIWEASDALAMVEATGCDGVVVGRGCLGKPWLFRDLTAAFEGRPVPPAPRLDEVCEVMVLHAGLLCDHLGIDKGVRDFRKHTGWYLKGYRVGSELRSRFSQISSLDELDDLIAEIDVDQSLPLDARRIPRGHTRGPKPVRLPDRWLEDPNELTGIAPESVLAVSGG